MFQFRNVGITPANHRPQLSLPQVIQEFRRRINTGHEQMVAGSCASQVKQVALGIVDLFEVGIIGGGFDSLLERNHFVIAGHRDDRAKFQALRQMHGVDGSEASDGLYVIIEHQGRELRGVGRRANAYEFRGGEHEDADFVWEYSPEVESGKAAPAKEGWRRQAEVAVPAYEAMQDQTGTGSRMLDILLEGVSTRQ